MGKQKRIWRESQHPRDAKGRFSRRGGEAWIKRAATELTSAPDAGATRDAAGRPRISRQAKAGVTLQAHADGGRPSAVRVPQAVKSAAPSPKNLADFNAQRLPTARKTAAPPVKNLAGFNALDAPRPVKRTPRPAPGAAALIAARREEQTPQMAAMVAARTAPETAPVNGADAYIAMRRHTLLALARDAKISIRGKTNTDIANELAAHDEQVKASRAAKLNPSGVGTPRPTVDTPRVDSQDGGMTSTTNEPEYVGPGEAFSRRAELQGRTVTVTTYDRLGKAKKVTGVVAGVDNLNGGTATQIRLEGRVKPIRLDSGIDLHPPKDGGMTPKPTKRQAAKLQAEQDAAERERQYQAQKAERDAQEATRRAEHEAAMEAKRAELRAKTPAGVRPADGRPGISTITSRTTNPREKWNLGNTPGTAGSAPNMVISPVGHIDNREANARIMNPLTPDGPYRYEIRDENTGEIIESGEDRDLDKVYAKANRIMSRTQGGGMARTAGKSTRFEARTTERPKDPSRGDFGKGPFYEHTVVEIDQDGNETVRVKTSSAAKAEANAVEMNAKEQAANPKAAPEPGSDEAKLAAKRAELEAARARFQREADWRPSGGMRTKSFGVRVDANLRRAGEAGRDIERLEHDIKVLELRARPKKPVTNDVEGLEPGDLVKMKNGLTYKVAKVNAKSVKVVVPPGMDDLMPKSKIVQTQKANVTAPKVEAPRTPTTGRKQIPRSTKEQAIADASAKAAPVKKAARAAPTEPQSTYRVRRSAWAGGGRISYELMRKDPDGVETLITSSYDEGALIKRRRALEAEQGPVIPSAKLEAEEAKLRTRLDAMRAKRAGNTRKRATQAELDVIERLQNLAPQLARSRREERATAERANPRGLGGMTGVDPEVVDRLVQRNLAREGRRNDEAEADAREAVANGTVPQAVVDAAMDLAGGVQETANRERVRQLIGLPELPPLNERRAEAIDGSEVRFGDLVLNADGTFPVQVTTILGSGDRRSAYGMGITGGRGVNLSGRVRVVRPKADAAPVAAPARSRITPDAKRGALASSPVDTSRVKSQNGGMTTTTNRERTGTYTGDISADRAERHANTALTDHVRTLVLSANDQQGPDDFGYGSSDQPVQVGDEVMVHTFGTWRRGIVTQTTRGGANGGNTRVMYSTPTGDHTVLETTDRTAGIMRLVDPSRRPAENRAALLPKMQGEVGASRGARSEEAKANAKLAKVDNDAAYEAWRDRRELEHDINSIIQEMEYTERRGGTYGPADVFNRRGDGSVIELAVRMGIPVPRRKADRDPDALRAEILKRIREHGAPEPVADQLKAHYLAANARMEAARKGQPLTDLPQAPNVPGYGRGKA